MASKNQEKKEIVRDLGFRGLTHIPLLRVHHKLLKELVNSFKLGKNTLEIGYGSFRVRPSTIGVALGLNTTGDIFPQKDHLMFKRIFILYIQMAFLLPTTINKIPPMDLAPIFKMDTIKESNWGGHVLNFIIKGITDYNLKKKKSINGCLFALMIVYFHLSKNKDKKGEERPPQPWIANWTREQLVERMREEMDEHMSQSKKKKVIVEDSSPEQAQSYHGSEIETEELEEFLRESKKKKNNEKSAAQGEKEADLRSTEGHYVSSETLSLVEESPNDQTEENMMVVQKETQSQTEALSIVLI
ncbi:hypothetical protein Ahy_A06g026580 [Arachis hypogaea]|uniref:Aminotransferase-like plant mobile domain-containing protein n=1 Tax=Arachis hypogaea TaxID=3818 RepID=A0A445CL18_ARAHY|nr:hypothetical protein Ahy_A06g026580 [Arachis hypogaea]